jgi:hypothetical protein
MLASYKKLTTALGFASVILTATAVSASAQMATYDDTWSHMSTPAANGECWHPTDAAFSERGYGYWGACPSAVRAQAAPSLHTHYRSTQRMRSEY